MPRLATLSEINRQAMLSFPCLEPDTTPWSSLGKPLSQAKISLVTSAGLHLRDDQPFIGDPKGGDTSYRIIPSTAKAADILQSHVSIGFDHTAIMRDVNVTLPMDRVRELVDQRVHWQPRAKLLLLHGSSPQSQALDRGHGTRGGQPSQR